MHTSAHTKCLKYKDCLNCLGIYSSIYKNNDFSFVIKPPKNNINICKHENSETILVFFQNKIIYNNIFELDYSSEDNLLKTINVLLTFR